MPAETTEWTADIARALPDDGKRYEVLDGELFDRHRKRIIYQSEHVPEYWIVDLDARLVERWRPDDERPEIVTEGLIWEPSPGLQPLAVDLDDFFAQILG